MDLLGEYNTEEEFLKSLHEFISIFETSKIVLWGNARLLKTFLAHVTTLDILYIVDVNEDLWGSTAYGYHIYSPEKIQLETDDVKIISLLSDSRRYDILDHLLKIGIGQEKFCTAYDYLTAYAFYTNKQVVLSNLELNITSKCSLRCEHCIAKIPYFKEHYSQDIPFDTIKENIDNIFDTVDYVDMFQFATGEVLLHKELDKILEYLHKNYYDRFNNLTFVTSATVIPEERLLEILRKYIGFIQISPYNHPDVEKKMKLPLIKTLFEKYNIQYVLSRYATGGDEQKWNDIGDLMTNHEKTFEENKQFFNQCSMKICKSMFDNKIFPCTVACYNHYGKINDTIPMDSSNLDYIDIKSNKLDIVRFYLNATTGGYPELCKYCNGVGERLNKNLVVAAKQVQKVKK